MLFWVVLGIFSLFLIIGIGLFVLSRLNQLSVSDNSYWERRKEEEQRRLNEERERIEREKADLEWVILHSKFTPALYITLAVITDRRITEIRPRHLWNFVQQELKEFSNPRGEKNKPTWGISIEMLTYFLRRLNLITNTTFKYPYSKTPIKYQIDLNRAKTLKQWCENDFPHLIGIVKSYVRQKEAEKRLKEALPFTREEEYE